MDDSTRRTFDTAMRGLAQDPYGGDSAALDGSPDRREATVAGVFVRYYVSRGILTVTVVRLVWI
nr:hypothetical protein [Streptomyces bohaiensis]